MTEDGKLIAAKLDMVLARQAEHGSKIEAIDKRTTATEINIARLQTRTSLTGRVMAAAVPALMAAAAVLWGLAKSGAL